MSLSIIKLIENYHYCIAANYAQKILGPYPSSLKFTAHSSISPKTSKRHFNSVRVQSDLSRPTYTTRLSSCSLRGKTQKRKEIKRGSLFFFSPFFLHRALMNWSWSLLWILTLSPRFVPPLRLSVVFLCDWLSLLPYLIELQFGSAFNLPWHHNSSFSLQLINQRQSDFYQMMPCLKFGAASSFMKSKNKAAWWLSHISEKDCFLGIKLTTHRKLGRIANWEVC